MSRLARGIPQAARTEPWACRKQSKVILISALRPLHQRKLFAKSSAVAFATTFVFWKVLFSPFSMRMRS